MTRSRRDFRGVLKPVGGVVLGLGVAIGLCAGAGWVIQWVSPRAGEPGGGPLALGISAAITIATGFAMLLYGRRFARESLTRREAVLSVALIWVSAGVFGALPFALGAGLSPIDAFFEAMSGFSTTGATVVTEIEARLSRPVLLWRSLIQWLGGMGIVVLFVAVFPNVGAGAKHMFRGETTGASSEGLTPRIADTSFTLWKLYVGFTALAFVTLLALGLGPFEAFCHSLTAMSTGGFSTRDASITAFDDPAVEYALVVFMLLGSVSFALYYAALRGRTFRGLLRSIELRVFLGIVVFSTAMLTLFNLEIYSYDPLESFRYSLFTVTTFISSTGYTTADYSAFPAPALTIILFLMFMGGCSGSTAGGMKVERFVLMTKQSWSEIHQSFRPAVVRVVRMGGKPIDPAILADVAAFLVVYLACLGAGVTVICAIEGIPVPTAFGAVLSCLSNMGPAPFFLEVDNFAGYSAAAKLVFVLEMVLGRLELFTLFALLVPGFWKR